jgi:phytoene dehydrogenase-like protein
VKPYGYVAFVDEAIHHATPFFEHRYVTPTELKAYLERKDKPKLEEITRATKAHAKRWGFNAKATLESYVMPRIIGSDEIAKWSKWLAMATAPETAEDIKDRKVRYTRQDFVNTMHPGEFELMLEDVGSQKGAERQKGGAGGWYAASIPHSGNPELRPKGKASLVRQASQPNLRNQWPAQLPEKVPRKFIRTWVRAVPSRSPRG